MNTDINQNKDVNKELQGVPTNLEFGLYLLEVYLNDRIEDEILRTMECPEQNRKIAEPFVQLKHQTI